MRKVKTTSRANGCILSAIAVPTAPLQTQHPATIAHDLLFKANSQKMFKDTCRPGRRHEGKTDLTHDRYVAPLRKFENMQKTFGGAGIKHVEYEIIA